MGDREEGSKIHRERHRNGDTDREKQRDREN